MKPLTRPLLHLDHAYNANWCIAYNTLLLRESVNDHLYQRINFLLEQYSPYCPDDNFLDTLRTQYWPALWQLIAFHALADGGFKPFLPPPDGPDFLFEIGGRRVWIEAISVSPGTGADAVPQRPLIGSFEIPFYKILLRTASGLSTKADKIEHWKKRGSLKDGDVLIIALHQNSCSAYHPSDSELSTVELACFGTKPERQYWNTKPEFFPRKNLWIPKANGARVELGVFGLPRYSKVSSVIYSRFGLHELLSFGRDAFRILHNPNAEISLSDDLVQFGRVQYVDAAGELQEAVYNPRGHDSYMGVIGFPEKK